MFFGQQAYLLSRVIELCGAVSCRPRTQRVNLGLLALVMWAAGACITASGQKERKEEIKSQTQSGVPLPHKMWRES